MAISYEIFNESELALAAYADMDDAQSIDAQRSALTEADMAQKQAIKFAERYTNVLAVADYPSSDFQATVFKSSGGQLTVALRGTLGSADLAEDAVLATYGVAYNQIVDMYNWWQKVTHIGMVDQYEIVSSITTVEEGVLLYEVEDNDHTPANNMKTYLVKKADQEPGTGELAGQTDINSVTVTGHSLGGHLASAFTALFSGQVEHAYTYNAPGFTDTESNTTFFAELGGYTPFDNAVTSKVTRVLANNALPGKTQADFIQDLHGGTPANETVTVAIENLGGTGNHSIVTVTDSLAVYNLLAKMDNNLSVDRYNGIFHAASNTVNNIDSLEAVIDSLQNLLGLGSATLPTGDREAFYQALYAVQGQVEQAGASLVNQFSVSQYTSVGEARSNFGAFLSVMTLAPFILKSTGAAAQTKLQSANSDLHSLWMQGTQGVSDQLLADRVDMLQLVWARNAHNKDPSSIDTGTYYEDEATNTVVGSNGSSRNRVYFGGDAADAFTGGDKNDHLYGGGDADTLSGGKGNDYLEGGTGNDTLNPGKGFDVLNGGAGSDTYQFTLDSFDNVTITGDADGGTISLLSGVTFHHVSADSAQDGLFLAIDSNGNWQSDKQGWSVAVSQGRATISLQDGDKRWHVITVEGFGFSGPTAYGLNLQGSISAPTISGMTDWNLQQTPTTEQLSQNNNITVYDPDKEQQVYSIEGFGGDDRIVMGADDDDQSRQSWDYIDGGPGSDQIYAAGGGDMVRAMGAQYDWQSYDSSAYDSFMEALYHNASTLAGVPLAMEVADEKNLLHGGDGDDWMGGASWQDTLDGGQGEDNLWAGAGGDVLIGGEGSDAMYGDSYMLDSDGESAFQADFIAPDVLPDMTAGEEDFRRAYFYKQGGTNGLRYSFDINTDYNDALDGGAGNDWLAGEIGHDVLHGGAGADRLFGDRTWSAGHFQSILIGAERRATYQPLASQFHGNDVLDGGADDDKLIGGGGDDALEGGSGADVLYGDVGMGVYDFAWEGSQKPPKEPVNAIKAADDGWWGQDTLRGGAGNDSLIGEGGDDVLDGGTEDDFLYGDWLNVSDASNPVADSNHNGQDTLYGGDGQDQLIGGSADDVLYGDSGNDVLVGDYFINGQYVGEGNDALYGGTGNDSLYGGMGADALAGGSGNDRLEGGDGNDTYTVSVGEGLDTLHDTQGDNTLRLVAAPVRVTQNGSGGQTTLTLDVAGASQVLLTTGTLANLKVIVQGNPNYKLAITAEGGGLNQNVNLFGSAGDDRLVGGQNTSVLGGGAGNDELVSGSGNNTVHGDDGDDVLMATNGYGALYGDVGNDVFDINGIALYGLNASFTVTGGIGQDRFLLRDGGACITINDAAFNGDTLQLDVTSDRVHLDDKGLHILNVGADASAQPLNAAASSVAYFNAASPLQNLSVQFSDNTVWTSAQIQAQLFAGTDWVDQVSGDAADNTLHGLGGNDQLYGLDGNDTLHGDAGEDALHGGNGNDVLEGGAGDDYVVGGSGHDVYVVDGNSGTDTWVDDWASINTVRFAAGVAPLSITAEQSEPFDGNVGRDLILRWQANDVENTVSLNQYFNEPSSGSNPARAVRIEFCDGTDGAVSTVWQQADIDRVLFRTAANVTNTNNIKLGLATDDVLNGNSSKNYLYGDAGNDTLNGSGGGDWLDGGAGNDTLTGGTGSDVFRFGVGAGVDVISDASSADCIRVDAGLGAGNFLLSKNTGNQLALSVKNGTDSIKFSNALGGIEDAAGHDVFVTESITVAAGTGTGDSVVTFSAQDLLNPALGKTELMRWQISAVEGLTADGWRDAPENLGFYALGFVKNFWSSGQNVIGMVPVEDTVLHLTFTRDDGVVLNRAIAVQAALGSDVWGDVGNDVIDMSQRWPEEGAPMLVIQAQAGDDALRGSAMDDFLIGGAGDDLLRGNDGNDTVWGGDGNDTFLADWGHDTLVGDAGNDIYNIGYLWGGDQDVIDNTTAAAGDVDTVAFSEHFVDYRQLWFAQSGSDLQITQLDQIHNGSVTVKDWYADTDNDGQVDDVGAGRVECITVQQDNNKQFSATVDASFDTLVQAMATFSANNGGIPTTLTNAVKDLHDQSGAWLAVSA